MTFDRGWMLMLAWLPLAWAALGWRRSARPGALALKALALSAVLLALAEPRLSAPSTRMAVSVLVDRSESVSAQDLARGSELAAVIERSRGRHLVRVIPFARAPGGGGRGTDIEAAIREGMAGAPAGRIPRLVLISDGKETQGSAARAAWQAQQLGIPIDTFLLRGRPKPDLRLEAVGLPALAFTGERFPLDLAVVSPRRTPAVVETSAEGKVLGTSEVMLEPGLNQLRVSASLSAAGAIDLSGAVRAEGLGEVRFAQVLSLRRPRVLFLSLDPPGSEEPLFRALREAQFEVQRAAELPGEDLGSFQIIVLNNWNLEASLTGGAKSRLEDFVRQGGGLLVIGGERNVYIERKDKREDPLERALPAKLAPPRSPEGTLVTLIVDKSSSMEGRKMELARLAAIGVIENLRPVDLVGVLIFDNSFQWAVPIRKAEDRTHIKRLVSGITPDGGTQIAPALAEAYRRLLPAQGVYKHIVLLTDGISEEGDSMAVAQDAARNRVTISTVGLGQDVNRAYLERLALSAKGKAYFLTDPSGLEQILLRDVMEHTGTTAVERPFRPVVMHAAEILEDVGMESAPPLAGYVRFTAKPSADTILSIDRKDPLLIRWQYGLGRTAVFASDAKSRWAAEWVGWRGFGRFWGNLFRDLLPHSQAGEASAEFDSANQEIVVNYRLAQDGGAPERVPDIFALGPAGFHRPVPIAKVAEGAWRGRVRIGDLQGLFRFRPLEESRWFPEIGLYRQEQELNDYGSDEAALRRISEFTGGRFEPALSQVFDSGGRTIPTTLRLWPALLAAAIALNLAELVLRKWKGVLETLRK